MDMEVQATARHGGMEVYSFAATAAAARGVDHLHHAGHPHAHHLAARVLRGFLDSIYS